MGSLNDWSSTANSNASVGAINWTEGQLPGTVNGSARVMMKDVADVRDGSVVLSGWHVKANGMKVYDPSDTTKIIQFDVSSISAGSTRTFAFPTTGGTLAKLTDITAAESINSKAAETVPATGDLIPFHSASAGAERKITVANLLKIINSLTEDTTPNSTDDLTITYSASAGAVRKVKLSNLVTSSPFSDSYESTEKSIAASTQLSMTHSLGGMPKMMQVVLKCKSTQNNYQVDDEVLWNDDAGNNRGIQISADATTLYISFGAQTPQLTDKNGGSFFAITPASWRVIARAWR